MEDVTKWLAEIDRLLEGLRVKAAAAYDELEAAQKRYSLLAREVACLEKARAAVEELQPGYEPPEVPL